METKNVAAADSFQVMERLDDELIEAELKNRVVKTWSYSFKDKEGRFQEGLSKVGVDESCVEMSKRGYIIREGKIGWERDPTNAEHILFQVPASLIRITTEGQEVLMDTVNGTKRQWTKMKLKSGVIVDDPFWFEKGAMKASRNARARLIPTETKAKILVLARESGKSRDISSESDISPDEPPTPKSKAEPKQSKKQGEKPDSKYAMVTCDNPESKQHNNEVSEIFCARTCPHDNCATKKQVQEKLED